MSHFTIEQTAGILDLPPAIVDQLVRSGQLPSTADGVPADAIQSYLSQSFIRLFQAQAKEPVAKEPETLIVRSIADYEEDLRIAPRYVSRRQLSGTFRGISFTLMQLSTTGVRIRHDATLRAGDVARLTVSLQRPARTFAMLARVVWTSIAQRGDSPAFCISGLRVIDPGPLEQVIHHLREARELHADEGRRRRVQPLSGLTDDEVASIIRVVRRFTADPDEAGRWYARARLSLADDQIRAAAPARSRGGGRRLGVPRAEARHRQGDQRRHLAASDARECGRSADGDLNTGFSPPSPRAAHPLPLRSCRSRTRAVPRPLRTAASR